MSEYLLECRNLSKDFPIGHGKRLHAVSEVSLQIREGEILGLVGESGCGKSTLGRTLIRLLQPTGGELFFRGENVTKLRERDFRPYRRQMQMIFQDPYASLDPRMDVRALIAEPLQTHHVCATAAETTARVLELMEAVGLPGEFLHRYPHQFSGGQRQRIGIARAIALDPALIVCDEPVSALDVSVQNQILNLLKELRDRKHLTYLFISHDLSVVRFLADRVCVMFLGRICEIAPTASLYEKPLHPYTRFLLNAVPKCDPHARSEETALLTGEVPSPVEVPSGCPFHTRCPYADGRCQSELPALRTLGDHAVACHRAEELLQ